MKEKKVKEKKIERAIHRIQKSTLTLSNIFIKKHDRLRRKYKWYYRWHTFSFTHWLHWFIFIVSLTFFIVITFQLVQIYRSNKKTYLTYTIVNQKNWTENENAVNLDIEEGKVQLSIEEDKDIFYPVGDLEKKINMSEGVIWQDISWEADVPSGTEMTIKIKGNNQDLEESWEFAEWVEYSTSNSRMTWGNSEDLNPKYRYLLIKVCFTSDGKSTPNVSRLDLNYKLEQETVIGGFIKTKIRKYLPMLFQKIYEREKIL